MSARTASPAPPHLARPLVWKLAALGVACAVVAAFALLSGSALLGVFALAFGAALIGFARSLQVRIPAAQLVNTAGQHLARGNIAEAEALLAAVGKAAARDGVIARAVATLRAFIALYDGRVEESEAFATIAIDKRLGLVTRAFEKQQITAAHAVRALARAARGDAAGAKLDADLAESSVDATPEVIARARLVRAILASRAAYHEEAFRTYLAANARLVLEHAMPRERALFRALRRMSRSPERSVYREPARTRDDRAPSKLASWIATMAPEAAAYIEGDRLLADSVAEMPIESGVPSDIRALRSARAGKSSAARPPRGRLLVLWLVLIGMFLTIWQFLTPAGPAPPAPVTPSEPSWLASTLVTAVPVLLFGLVLTVMVSMARHQQRALSVARRLAALGERERAKPALVELAAGRNGMVAATAGLELARLAAQEANFPEAIARCDAAIARLQVQSLRAAAADTLLPALLTESAVAMAARGGVDEAAAELAVLGRDFPTYALLATAQLRVRLLSAVQQGDRSAAHALAKARTASMPFPYREDVLADLTLAARGDLQDEDLARLDAELDDDAELRTWLDRVAPGLREDRPLAERARVAARAAERMSEAREEALDAEERARAREEALDVEERARAR